MVTLATIISGHGDLADVLLLIAAVLLLLAAAAASPKATSVPASASSMLGWLGLTLVACALLVV